MNKNRDFKQALWWGMLAAGSMLALAGIGAKAHADSSPRLALRVHGTWTLEVAVASPVSGIIWKRQAGGEIDGGAFIQTLAAANGVTQGCEARKDGSGVCRRLTIAIDKPLDKLATLKLQFPGRTAGITAPVGASQAVIRLSELSLDDFGLASLQLTVMGAVQAQFGVFNLSTYDTDPSPAAQPAATIDGVPVDSASQVKAGWHFLWFGPGKRLDVVEDPTELLSLCGFFPGGKHECVTGSDQEVYIRDKGSYLFVVWDKHLESSVYSVTGI